MQEYDKYDTDGVVNYDGCNKYGRLPNNMADKYDMTGYEDPDLSLIHISEPTRPY